MNFFDKYEYDGWFLYFDIKNNYSDYYFFICYILYMIKILDHEQDGVEKF